MTGTIGPRATLKDVARESGVSPATVSFVLNETPGQTISADTRRRVRAAAQRLGYTPHRIARTLREGASRTVLLSTAGLPTGHSLESFTAGLDEELRSLGHILLVTHRRADDLLTRDLVETFAPRAVLDLAALYGGEDAPAWEGGWVDGLAAHGLAQIRYLAEQGHREIAVVLPRVGVDQRFAALRLRHVREAATSLRLAPPTEIWIDDDTRGASRELAALRRRHPTTTAIAAFSDDAALVTLAGLAELGLQAPADVAVIGFDEGRHGALWRPGLTTVRIDAHAYGRRAARGALGLAPAPGRPAPSRIVRRESA